MDISRLVSMANQIAAFFEAWPDKDEARKNVAQHLRNFWEPRMRKEIIDFVRNGGDGGLKSLAREAVLLLAAETQSANNAT